MGGSYMAIRFDKDTSLKLEKWCQENGVENHVKDFHTTIMYSRKEVDITPTKYTVSVSPGTYKLGILGENYLVLLYECPKLQERFKECMDKGAQYDFPKYDIHVTLSYEHHTVDSLKNMKEPTFDLVLEGEYYEELNED